MAELTLTVSDEESNTSLTTEYRWCKNEFCRDYLNNIKYSEADF